MPSHGGTRQKGAVIPGFDGTGPWGQGPLTGGGRGMGAGNGRGGGRDQRGAGLRRRDGSCRSEADAGASSVVARARRLAVVARAEDCTACALCVDACPRQAITVDDVARVDAAHCNGCGLCATECPNDVFKLQEA